MSLYRAGSLKTVAEEIPKYKLDLVGVQEVRWDRGGTKPAGKYTFFYGKGNENKKRLNSGNSCCHSFQSSLLICYLKL
jgi:hypothetical protein